MTALPRMYSISMRHSSQLLAGIGIGDRQHERAGTGGNQDDIEHGCFLSVNGEAGLLGDPQQSQGHGNRKRHCEVDRQQNADLGQHLARRRTIAGSGSRPMIGVERARQDTNWQPHSVSKVDPEGIGIRRRIRPMDVGMA